MSNEARGWLAVLSGAAAAAAFSLLGSVHGVARAVLAAVGGAFVSGYFLLVRKVGPSQHG
jgi:hypothetical protein